MGVSTLLRELEQHGYHVQLQHHKPNAHKRLEFQQSYFDHLVTDWNLACSDPRALLIEDSPWAYLCRHAVHMAPAAREKCHLTLAPLKLPDFSIILSTSGVEIGRRFREWKGTPEEYSHHALRQMQQLQLHPSATFHVDATAAPPQLCKRVHSLLSKRAFHVDVGNFEGMNFIPNDDSKASSFTVKEGATLAKTLLLRDFSLDVTGLHKLQRLKEILDFHPSIVNPSLSPLDQSYYFQTLHDCLDAIAIVLEDITGDKDVEPFVVETFGEPAHRPPIRLPPAHRKFVREEF